MFPQNPVKQWTIGVEEIVMIVLAGLAMLYWLFFLRCAPFLRAHTDFLLIAHVAPDGDTLGSCLALRLLLEQLGKRARVVCDDPVPHLYAFLPGADQILTADAPLEAAATTGLLQVLPPSRLVETIRSFCPWSVS